MTAEIERSLAWARLDLADARDLGRVLEDGYRFKEMADYWTDPEDTVSDRDAAVMIEAASRLVDRVAALLSMPHPGADG